MNGLGNSFDPTSMTMLSPWNPQPTRARVNATSIPATPRENIHEQSSPQSRNTINSSGWNFDRNDNSNGQSGFGSLTGSHGLGGLDGNSTFSATLGLTSRTSNLSMQISDLDSVWELTNRMNQITAAVNESKEFIARFEREKELLDQSYAKQISSLRQNVVDVQNGSTDIIVRELQNENRSLRALIDATSFVLVLVNGNTLSFSEDLLSNGEAGGKEAAQQLHERLRLQIPYHVQYAHRDTRIMIRMYADFRHFARSSPFHGSRAAVADFARGFTSQELCEFIDAGSNVDGKFLEILKLNTANVHCSHIFLGCSSHDSLTRFASCQKNSTPHGFSLLQTPDLEPGSVNVGCGVADLNNLFTFHNFDNTSSSTQSLNGHTNRNVAVPKPVVARPHSTSTEKSEGAANPSSNVSWASAVLKVPDPVVPTPPKARSAASVTPKKAPVPPVIERNRLGQRIDPTIPHDKEEVERVKRLKMCNMHFIRNECPYGNGCSHKHDRSPTEKELQTLRLVARMAPCMHGTACDDPKCIYGHICPAPVGRNGQEKKDKNCIFGEACKFEPEMHRVDRVPVKTLKI